VVEERLRKKPRNIFLTMFHVFCNKRNKKRENTGCTEKLALFLFPVTLKMVGKEGNNITILGGDGMFAHIFIKIPPYHADRLLLEYL